MASIPYMPFYIADYLADTVCLSTFEHGAYLLLIMNYWQTGIPLPNDDKKLAKIETELELAKIKAEKLLAHTGLRLPSHEWKEIRLNIFIRDNFTCQYCGEYGKKLECDHIIPVARGGTHTDDNLVTACFKCNRSKRNKTPKEWLP